MAAERPDQGAGGAPSGPVRPRILVSDAGGTTTRFLASRAEELGAEVTGIEQAASLVVRASREGADLVVVAQPASFAPLERLRNDPRTRHIPVILLASPTGDQEKDHLALVGTSQVLDWPYEEHALLAHVRAYLGKRGRGAGIGFHDYAIARVGEDVALGWAGRICWVTPRTLRLETDVLLPEGSIQEIEGFLVRALGRERLAVRVVSSSRDDVFYNHGMRSELALLEEVPDELDPQRDQASVDLAAAVRGERFAAAPRKRKVAVLCGRSTRMTRVAATLDPRRWALRWIRSAEELAKALPHLNPALLLVHPRLPDLAEPLAAGKLLRVTAEGPPVVPFGPPGEEKIWEKLAARGTPLEVPDPGDREAWNELLERLLPPRAEDHPDRVYLAREHRFSHAIVRGTGRLTSICEVGGTLELPLDVAAEARAHLVVPSLLRAGIARLHGRVLETAPAKRPVRIAFMGVGGDRYQTLLRRHVQEIIMEARRKEFQQG